MITVAEASQKYLTAKPGKQPKDYTFLQAWIQFMEEGISRSRQPFSASTQKAYKGLWRKWINPRLRARKIFAFTPLEMKTFIKELRTNKLADKTVTLVVTLLRSIIRSVRDDQGNRVFATQYDADFIDLPEVRKRDQKTPSITREQLEAAIVGEDETALLLIFLASTGLRIGEALAVRPGNLPDEVSHYWAGTPRGPTLRRYSPYRGVQCRGMRRPAWSLAGTVLRVFQFGPDRRERFEGHRRRQHSFDVEVNRPRQQDRSA